MPAANISGWIRIGVWALPVYGVLTFWATLTHEPDRQNEVEAYARYISTTDYLAQHLLGSILGTIHGGGLARSYTQHITVIRAGYFPPPAGPVSDSRESETPEACFRE